MTPDGIAKLVARAKEEILADIERGIIPAGVDSFSELHDYVDANCYAGMCEDDSPIWKEPRPDGPFDAANAVQDEVHRWLVAGRKEVAP